MYGMSTVREILSIKNREKLSIRKTGKRFELKTRYVGFRLVDNFICKCIEHFFKLPMRIIEFLASNKYRKHVIKKLNT